MLNLNFRNLQITYNWPGHTVQQQSINPAMCPSVLVCPWTGHWTPNLFQRSRFWLALFSPWPPTHKYKHGLMLFIKKKKKDSEIPPALPRLHRTLSNGLYLDIVPLSVLLCLLITYFSVHLFTLNLRVSVFFSHRRLHPCLSFSHPSFLFNLRGEREIRWERGKGRKERERLSQQICNCESDWNSGQITWDREREVNEKTDNMTGRNEEEEWNKQQSKRQGWNGEGGVRKWWMRKINNKDKAIGGLFQMSIVSLTWFFCRYENSWDGWTEHLK